jgi:hypothetical protein
VKQGISEPAADLREESASGGGGKTSARLWSITSIAVPLLAATVALVQSWNRWLEPVIDLGRDLYIPGELLRGSQLYSDILYYYPPTAPYLLAAITAVIGRSLPAYTFIGIMTAAICGAALYLVARAAAGVPAAGAILLTFASLNVAAGTTWGANFIYPYAHAATFGMTFLLLGVSFLYRHLFHGRSVAAGWAAVAFLLLAGITKIEWTAGTIALMAMAVIVYRLQLRYVAGFTGGLLAALLVFQLHFSDRRPGHHWLMENVLASSLLQGESARHFYGQVSGLGSLQENLTRTLTGLVLIAFVVLLLAAIDRAAAGGRRLLAFAAGATLLVVFGVASPELFFVGWAPVMILLVPLALLEWRSSPLLFFLSFALLAAARIILFLGPWWYGFVLTLPLYLLIGYVLFRLLPERRVYSHGAARLWLLFFLIVAARGLSDARERYAEKSWPVETAHGRFHETPHRGAALTGLLRWMEQQPPDTTLVVMPEGLALNYFTGRPNPLSFHTFTPVEIADPVIEQRIVAELSERRPDLIVLVPRDVTEFGYRGLGVDYGLEIRRLIEQEYVPAGRAGGESYPVTVFRLKRD